MKNYYSKVIQLIEEKVFVYQSLADLLKQEGDVLVKADVKALWEITEKKQTNAKHIEKIRHDILDSLADASISLDMDISSFSIPKMLSAIPEELKIKINHDCIAIYNLKKEITALVNINKHFVKDSLDVINNLINMMTKQESTHCLYNNKEFVVLENNSNKNLLHKEV